MAAPSSDPNDPAQQPYLFAADRARRIGLGNSCEASQETATLLASGGFAGRESALVTDHDLGRMVSVVAMQTAGLDLVEDRDLQGAKLAGRDLGLVDQVPYLGIGQRVQLGGDCVWAIQPGRQQITDPWRFGFGATNIAVMVGNIPKGYDTQRWIPVEAQIPRIVCQFCGLTMRGSDDVVMVESSPESETETVVHASCAEAARLPKASWDHTDVKTLTEWARGIGWGSAT